MREAGARVGKPRLPEMSTSIRAGQAAVDGRHPRDPDTLIGPSDSSCRRLVSSRPGARRSSPCSPCRVSRRHVRAFRCSGYPSTLSRCSASSSPRPRRRRCDRRRRSVAAPHREGSRAGSTFRHERGVGPGRQPAPFSRRCSSHRADGGIQGRFEQTVRRHHAISVVISASSALTSRPRCRRCCCDRDARVESCSASSACSTVIRTATTATDTQPRTRTQAVIASHSRGVRGCRRPAESDCRPASCRGGLRVLLLNVQLPPAASCGERTKSARIEKILSETEGDRRDHHDRRLQPHLAVSADNTAFFFIALSPGRNGLGAQQARSLVESLNAGC